MNRLDEQPAMSQTGNVMRRKKISPIYNRHPGDAKGVGCVDASEHAHRRREISRVSVLEEERSVVSFGSLNINLVSRLDDDPSRLFIVAVSSVLRFNCYIRCPRPNVHDDEYSPSLARSLAGA